MAAAGAPGSVCNREQLEAKPGGRREAPWATSREHPSQAMAFSQGRGWTVQDPLLHVWVSAPPRFHPLPPFPLLVVPA